MVAKVISGQDIKGALNYNEQKVLEGVAQCIQASGFLKDASELNFYDKLQRFTNLNERNSRTKTNTLHISLNFDVTEKPTVDELNRIALTYMDKIGFGNQPYLVYQHNDAAHPHIHIVTTLVQENGKRIPIHNIGKNQSETARKEIEIEFGLVKADGKKKDQAEFLRPIDIQKAIYGKSETRRSITNIVRTVTRHYKYTSLPELNAVLRQYNVTADRGSEKSKMFEKKGLLYSLINAKGKRIGIPIKASSIYGKPTLAFLEKQFKLNEVLRQPHREQLKKTIDRVMQSPGVLTKQQFISELDKRGIAVVLRTNAEGRTYGITFIDNKVRVVFNGSALGKPYSANAILEKLSAKEETITPFRPGYTKSTSPTSTHLQGQGSDTDNRKENAGSHGMDEVIKDLFTADGFDPSSPEAALRLGRRRRKRKGRRI